MTEKRLRGFAAMTPERRHEIAKKGGNAARLPGSRSFEKDHDLAREAGRKGGLAGKGKSKLPHAY